MRGHFPEKQGLYDPAFEKDSCGVGFVCDMKGRKSHDVISKGLEVLERMGHRGAVGADPRTGDGAGILIQIPHGFFVKRLREQGLSLPDPGEYGAGLIFMPRDPDCRKRCETILQDEILREGQIFLGWRDVPVDESMIGEVAKSKQPVIKQIFIGRGGSCRDQGSFERKLYVIRKVAEKKVSSSDIPGKDFFYITDLSSKKITYKGLLMPEQVPEYFPDLKDEDTVSALALVHSRYSTNTFPTWDLAQPFRYLAHNGEINTLRGNINWFRSGERLLASSLFGNDIAKIKPVIVEGGSDSASIDNVLELLVLGGRSLPHALMMLVPEAWEHNAGMKKEIRDFYAYHACIMEPWDGPAAIAFTDGTDIGALLDRNGLRPARYLITRDDLVVMSSEVGVLDLDPAEIKYSSRLEPGKILFIDTARQRVVSDDEIKNELSAKKPYGEWLNENLVGLEDLPSAVVTSKRTSDVFKMLRCFGYSREDLNAILKPMAEEGKEPVGSMGNDSPHAFLSKRPQLVFDHFKQLFAQVTNPAIDPIREDIVMSMETFAGTGSNILTESPDHCRKLSIPDPILTNSGLDKIKYVNTEGFKTKTVHMFFDPVREGDFVKALERICYEGAYAVEEGYNFLVLSDRGVNSEKAVLPSLLALSALHQHLVSMSIRTQISIIVESAEPREVNHFALLLAYGADAINPYLAYEAIEEMTRSGKLSCGKEKAVENYRKAVGGGILKILSKMGISTLRSYKGAQIFEALGLGKELVDAYFTNTVSRIGGVGLEGIRKDAVLRHEAAFSGFADGGYTALDTGGIYQWKRDGEFHLWNPESIALLQDSVRKGSYDVYKKFAALIDDQSENPTTIRSLFSFVERRSIPIEEVEPVENILRRFATGAMSYGSISRNAHETIAIAMNRIKGKSNTGEGGEDPARFVPLPNGDSRKSAIKQVASGRFGVTANYLINADEIQIKISQGAKPGEGGQLPGHKVSAIIARTRYTTQGVTLISPPPHHDIYSIEDLAQLIFDLKSVNPKARVSVKLVSEVGVGTIAAGVAKGHADMILISGADGGTGASPRTSIRHAGLPWELGLSETHQTLALNNLRDRVKLQTDGQMRTGRDVALAAILGAEEFGFCTAVLITLGCVMLRHCHLNNCSVGVATQDELLEKRFTGRPEYVVNYMNFVAMHLREIMASLGVRKLDDMVGMTDLIGINKGILPEKAENTDLSGILYRPDVTVDFSGSRKTEVENDNRNRLDQEIIRVSEDAIDRGTPVSAQYHIRNYDRAVGARLSGRVCADRGEQGLSEDTIKCRFDGFAGQSFGAFLARGITFELAGMANDYVGKSLSGGKIIIFPGKGATYVPEDNVIIGNTCFYGAVAGEAYIRGRAGERFCVRNSGLYAVVEGVGDHGCEYMTGGRVVVLGKTGRNFAAGMSGGIAYIYDKDHDFSEKCNRSMVEIETLTDEDRNLVSELVGNHHRNTLSKVAERILENFSEEITRFIKVMPIEYKRVLGAKEMEEKMGLGEVSDG
ncbi:MAG: glutamate synthase large subunit [Candidatus Omnitrophota bacterium]